MGLRACLVAENPPQNEAANPRRGDIYGSSGIRIQLYASNACTVIRQFPEIQFVCNKIDRLILVQRIVFSAKQIGPGDYKSRTCRGT